MNERRGKGGEGNSIERRSLEEPLRLEHEDDEVDNLSDALLRVVDDEIGVRGRFVKAVCERGADAHRQGQESERTMTGGEERERDSPTPVKPITLPSRAFL
jgi:hypothetical protein